MMHNDDFIIINNEKITVDSGIKSLLVLLNSFEGVETVFSCAGPLQDNNGNYTSAWPYVLFVCKDYDVLKEIIRFVQAYYFSDTDINIHTDLMYNRQTGEINYGLYFRGDTDPNNLVRYYIEVYTHRDTEKD